MPKCSPYRQITRYDSKIRKFTIDLLHLISGVIAPYKVITINVDLLHNLCCKAPINQPFAFKLIILKLSFRNGHLGHPIFSHLMVIISLILTYRLQDSTRRTERKTMMMRPTPRHAHTARIAARKGVLIKVSSSLMCESLSVTCCRWFPPPVKLTFHHHHHRLAMTLAVAEALNPNQPNQTKGMVQ